MLWSSFKQNCFEKPQNLTILRTRFGNKVIEIKTTYFLYQKVIKGRKAFTSYPFN